LWVTDAVGMDFPHVTRAVRIRRDGYAYREDSGTGYRGSGPQVMATCRNIAISPLYLAGVTAINRTLQAIGRDRTRMLSYLPL
jgi:hypothetical protein